MGTNDAREQLDVCKREYTKLEQEHEDLVQRFDALLAAFASVLAQIGFNREMIDKILEEY